MARSFRIHRTLSNTSAMARLAVLVAMVMALSGPGFSLGARASDGGRACLSKAEQKAAISSGHTVTLAEAIRSIRGTVRGRGSHEVLRARLCREPRGLVYLLTVLGRDGKVTHMAVDATSGKVVDAR